jgi:hypothetical protein
VFLKSAKGAAHTTNRTRNKSAPHSVLRVFLKSAKGAAHTTNRTRNKSAPHSVLRVFLKVGAVAVIAPVLLPAWTPGTLTRER